MKTTANITVVQIRNGNIVKDLNNHVRQTKENYLQKKKIKKKSMLWA